MGAALVEDSGAYAGTCDAGDCDEETAAVVLTADDEWISFCVTHAISEMLARLAANR